MLHGPLISAFWFNYRNSVRQALLKGHHIFVVKGIVCLDKVADYTGSEHSLRGWSGWGQLRISDKQGCNLTTGHTLL
jgi:hypothetical protein